MRNVGTWDRAARVVLALVLAYLATRTGGGWAWVAGLAALVAALTAVVGYCPLYALLGIRTCPAPRQR
jgi:hypothetical protein